MDGPFLFGPELRRFIRIFWQAGGKLFDLLLHFPDLLQDKRHRIARFFGFQRFFIIGCVGPGNAWRTGNRALCFGEVEFQEDVQGDIKIIADDQQFVKAGFTNPIFPIANGCLALLDERCNLRLGSGGLLP